MMFSLPSQGSKLRSYLLVGGFGCILAILGASAARIAAEPQATSPKPHAKVIFARDIAPIFQKNCNSCHGSDKPQGGLRLDSEAADRKSTRLNSSHLGI